MHPKVCVYFKSNQQQNIGSTHRSILDLGNNRLEKDPDWKKNRSKRNGAISDETKSTQTYH